LLDDALEKERRLGGVYRVVETLNQCGDAALVAGEVARARAYYREALDLALRSPMPLHVAATLEGLALLATHYSQLECATRLLGRADAIRDAIGAPRSPSREQLIEPATCRSQELAPAYLADLTAQGRRERLRNLAAAALDVGVCRPKS